MRLYRFISAITSWCGHAGCHLHKRQIGLMDPTKPPGHACDANGNLRDASELDWDESSDDIILSPKLTIAQHKVKDTKLKTFLGKRVLMETATHSHCKLTSAKPQEVN